MGDNLRDGGVAGMVVSSASHISDSWANHTLGSLHHFVRIDTEHVLQAFARHTGSIPKDSDIFSQKNNAFARQ